MHLLEFRQCNPHGFVCACATPAITQPLEATNLHHSSASLAHRQYHRRCIQCESTLPCWGFFLMNAPVFVTVRFYWCVLYVLAFVWARLATRIHYKCHIRKKRLRFTCLPENLVNFFAFEKCKQIECGPHALHMMTIGRAYNAHNHRFACNLMENCSPWLSGCWHVSRWLQLNRLLSKITISWTHIIWDACSADHRPEVVWYANAHAYSYP